MHVSKRQAVHWMFDGAIIIKALNGVLELVGGYFLIYKPGWIGPHAASWAWILLDEHPGNWLARDIAHWGDALTLDTEHFAATLLIGHGVAKVLIAWGLLLEKMWAFPLGLVVFGTLIGYQLHRYQHTHSVFLGLLIVVDVAVWYLIWREYGFRRQEVGSKAVATPAS